MIFNNLVQIFDDKDIGIDGNVFEKQIRIVVW